GQLAAEIVEDEVGEVDPAELDQTREEALEAEAAGGFELVGLLIFLVVGVLGLGDRASVLRFRLRSPEGRRPITAGRIRFALGPTVGLRDRALPLVRMPDLPPGLPPPLQPLEQLGVLDAGPPEPHRGVGRLLVVLGLRELDLEARDRLGVRAGGLLVAAGGL